MAQVLDSKLKLIESLVEYLDVSGSFDILKQQCVRYSQTKSLLVYTFKILIDPVDICERNSELGNTILNDPNDAIVLIREVVYQIVTVLDLLPGDRTFPQISVIIRLTSLPALSKSNTIENSSDLSKLSLLHGFVRLRGIVIGATAISKYTQSTRYRCPDEDCEGHHGNQYIRVHIPGASEAQTIRNDFSCTFCWKHLEEEKSCRYLSEKMVIEVVPWNDSQNNMQSYRIQAIPVYLRDDLTRAVEIGGQYDVIGLIRKDIQAENITLAIEANNICKISDNHITRPSYAGKLPKTIQDLYQDRKCSPWSFILSLAYFFAYQICPAGNYLRLKMCVLLSLVSDPVFQKSKTDNPIHLLAVGQDTNILYRLLMYGQKFAFRSWVHTTCSHMTGKVTCDKYGSAPYFLEGGSFHLAKNGVCYLGDVNKYKKSVKEQIQTTLSQGRFIVDISSKFTRGLPQQLEEHLSCCVWGYSDVSNRRQNSDPFLGQDVNDSSKTLFESFSLVHYTDSGSSSLNEDAAISLAHYQLSAENQSSVITDEDFKIFLRIARSLSPSMTTECENLIHRYYIASRKTRSSNTNSQVPVSALQTLYSLAVNHAKLSLRQEVLIEDGLMAILIYEESLTARLGQGILSIQPTPHVPPDNIQQYLGKENDKMMRQFHVNVLRFCVNQATLEE